MARILIYLAGLSLSAIVMFRSDPGGAWFAISSGLAIGFAIPLIDSLIIHARGLRIAWYSLRTWRGRVRISASYLYRIHVDNEYLLVKGQRFDHYQPVGGVYKTHRSSSGKRSELGILDDDLLVPDAVSEGDLRVRVPGRKLIPFVKWFEGGHGRETDGWREFYEELIATGILPGDPFRCIRYDYIGRQYKRLRYSPWAKSQELLIADILELIPTDTQLSALRQLRERADPRVLWATERQIRRLGAADGAATQTTRIAETAIWTIDTAD